LSQTVRSLAVGEATPNNPVGGALPTEDAKSDREPKPSLQGPHWGPEHMQKMLERMDEIDRLAEDGLA
jgi:hypothetical protein